MPVIERDFGEMYLRVSGSGEPVILLHEYFGTHQSWSAQIGELARHFQVVAPDLRGHGRSRMGTNERITITGIVEDLLAVSSELDLGPVHIIGCSLGAVAGMSLASAEPESVRSLTLASVPSISSEDAIAYGRHYVADIFPRIEPDLDRIHGDGEPGYARRVLLRNFAQDLDERPADHSDSIARSGGISAPALVVGGENDPVFNPDRALSLAGQIPAASLTILPSCGHLAHQELPGVFNTLVVDHLMRNSRGVEPGQA